MLITATTFLTFVFIALVLLGLGYYTKNVLALGLGCLLLVIFGSFLWIEGFAEPVGENVTYTIVNNTVTAETATIVYENNKGWWTDALGIIMGLGGFGLAFMMVTEYLDEKRKKDRNLELPEE